MRKSGTGSTKAPGDAEWVVPCSLLVAAQHAVGFMLSRVLHFAPAPPTGAYMTIAAVLTACALTAALMRELWRMARAAEERPAQVLVRKISANWSHLLLYAIGFQLVALQIAALTWLKGMLPLIVPFWADPMLARLDFALFGGDPARLVQWAVPLVEPMYIGWAIVKFAVLIALLSLPASELKRRALLAYFLTVGVAGVGGQFLISSAGPLFYERLGFGTAYAPLIAELKHSAPATIRMSDYLWSTYSNGATSIGTGISAMPSIHVAVAAWIFLVAREFSRRLKWLALGYWIAIFVGSVALGWHYVSDAVVGSTAALAAWKAAAIVRWPSERIAMRPALRRG